MKKFQFALDTVLDYKQQVQEGLQNEHALLLQKVRQQQRDLEELQERYRCCNREFRQAEAEGITVAEALRFESGLRFWQKEIQKAEQLLTQYQKEAEEKRKQVVSARQDTSSLEKLRERKQEDYRKAAAKGEELFIEELVAAQRAAAEKVG